MKYKWFYRSSISFYISSLDSLTYKKINHSRQDQPQVYAFGINYDAYLDTHTRDFMHYLSTIKYPADPNNRSYMPSRARWISHYARQIQLANANGAAPAISLTIQILTHIYRDSLPHRV